MKSIQIIPKKINGSIIVPGSKSISNRVLLMAALGDGCVGIENLLFSRDTQVMIEALRLCGIRIEVINEVVKVYGSSGNLKNPGKELYLENAGTAMRFLTSIATIIPGETVLIGNSRMKERPIKDLVDALKLNGVEIDYLENEGYPPLKIKSSNLKGRDIEISGSISSQYISSLLILSPYSQKATRLILKGGTTSHPYIYMTVQLMRQFANHVSGDISRVCQQTENNSFSSKIFSIPQKNYQLPEKYFVESDASSASYPLAMAAITGGKVTVNNLGKESLQGDTNFYIVLEKMGCEVQQTETTTTVIGVHQLKAITIDLNSMTDTFMTVCALAAVAEGTTKIYNIANQRVKECDRISAMATELSKCGIEVKEFEDGLEITGGNPHGAEIECYDDHRIAMSFAVLGCKVPGIIITDKECTAKTYPGFWDDIEKEFGVSCVM